MFAPVFTVCTVFPTDDSASDAPLGGAAGRELLERELEKPIYQEHHSILKGLISQLIELFSGAHFNPDLPSFNWIVVALLIAVMAAVATLLLTNSSWRIHAPTTGKKPKDSVVFDDNRSAIQYLAAARAAVGREDFSVAFLEQFRHLMKMCEGEGKLVIPPGLTAVEASQKLTRIAPNFGVDLNWAATQFNALRFGHRQALPADFHRIRILDENLERQIKSHSPLAHPSAQLAATAPTPALAAASTEVTS